MAELDKQAVALAKAISLRETRGQRNPYKAKGKSGEHGAYQIKPTTWKLWAGRYLGNPNAPMTEENQNFVAYRRIKEWKDKGLNPAQIAAAWNGGEGVLRNDRWKKMRGINEHGASYDIPAYVQEVYSTYKELVKPVPLPQQKVEEALIKAKEVPPEVELEKMSHSKLLELRALNEGDMEIQKRVAPYEHRAWAREYAEQNKLSAPIIPILSGVYQGVKAAGIELGEGQTPADINQFTQAVVGAYEGFVKPQSRKEEGAMVVAAGESNDNASNQ